MRSWFLKLSTALLVVFLAGSAAAQEATIEKILEEGPNPVPLAAAEPTTYVLRITYTSHGGPEVTVLDTIPAEFEKVAVDDDGACTNLNLSRLAGKAGQHGKSGKGARGATKISCELPAGTDAVLHVTMQTRQSPGSLGRGGGPAVFGPASCEEGGSLRLNDGAVAVGPDFIVSSNVLSVDVEGCDEVPSFEEPLEE
jgi:hypothetical protein